MTKRFDKIVIGNEDAIINGDGHYKRTNSSLLIESDSHSISFYFKQSIVNDPLISSITFEKDNETIGVHAGQFLVKNIQGNIITLSK